MARNSKISFYKNQPGSATSLEEPSVVIPKDDRNVQRKSTTEAPARAIMKLPPKPSTPILQQAVIEKDSEGQQQQLETSKRPVIEEQNTGQLACVDRASS